MKKLIIIILIIGILIISGCNTTKKKDCNSVSAPNVNVICKGEVLKYCYAYPSGEKDIMYGGAGYQDDGLMTEMGEIFAGGVIFVGDYRWLNHVEVFPNLNGVFCKNKLVRIDRADFIFEK